MSRIESSTELINKGAEEVFNYLKVPENYRVLMPKQVRSFEADAMSAVLDIEGLGKLKLEFTETREYEFILMKPVKPVPVDFEIQWHIKPLDASTSEVKAIIEAKLNMFMKPIVEPVMRNLLNAQVSRLKEEMNKS